MLREKDAVAFDAAAARFLAKLLPHVRHSNQIGARLAKAASSSAAAPAGVLSHLPVAGVLTDAAGRCLDANEHFRAEMSQLGIHLKFGRMCFDDENMQSIWTSALHGVDTSAVARTLTLQRRGGMQWMLTSREVV